MKYNFYFCLRVHCFNYYGKNKDKKCPDLELRYYIECHKKLNDLRRRRSPIVCQAEAPKSTTDSAPTTTDSLEPTTEATKAATTKVATTAGATTPTVAETTKGLEAAPTTRPDQPTGWLESTTIADNNAVTTAQEVPEDVADALGELDNLF